MITGAHAMIYSKDAEADRAFLKDVLGLSHVDVGGGWLIFALPPSEVAVHPGKKSAHELYFMCEDVNAFRSFLESKDVTVSPVQDQGWGLVTSVTLPGGGELGVYEPRHARPSVATAATAKSARPRAGDARTGKSVAGAAAARIASKPARPKAAASKPLAAKAAPPRAGTKKSAAAKAAAPKAAPQRPSAAKSATAPGKAKKALRARR
jgi:hypothetical protein